MIDVTKYHLIADYFVMGSPNIYWTICVCVCV